MNKFTKMSAAALFALFLTACDKPAEKKAEAPAQETPAAKVDEKKAEPAQTEAAKAEEAKAEEAKTEEAKAETPKTAEEIQGAEDFKKLVAWNAEQEKQMADVQNELQQKVATQDATEIKNAFTTFTAKVGEVIASLEAIEIKNADVQKLKDKLKESLSLSQEVLNGSLQAMGAEPSEALQAELQAKAQQLIQISTELETIQNELKQKFMQ